jgi:methylphosphotriester-DNA--protein-cysteine methyltransferase
VCAFVQVATGPPELSSLSDDVSAAANTLRTVGRRVEDVEAVQEQAAVRAERQAMVLDRVQVTSAAAEASVTELTARIAAEVARSIAYTNAAVVPLAKASEVQV